MFADGRSRHEGRPDKTRQKGAILDEPTRRPLLPVPLDRTHFVKRQKTPNSDLWASTIEVAMGAYARPRRTVLSDERGLLRPPRCIEASPILALSHTRRGTQRRSTPIFRAAAWPVPQHRATSSRTVNTDKSAPCGKRSMGGAAQHREVGSVTLDLE